MAYNTYKGYDIEFNFYGRNEYTVQVCGDDMWFDSEEKAKAAIDDLVKDPEYQIPGAEEEETTPDNYFIRNKETGKLELHFEKDYYTGLSADDKAKIKSNFLWGRKSECWISRCKEPNLYHAIQAAKKIGLVDAGEVGERLSFAEQMERKAAKAERRAERYENRAEKHAEEGERLQKPIKDKHGDIAFFTQPNINSSAGRAFARQRERMFEAFNRGFEEFNKSEYWKDRSATARATADQAELKNKAFIERRIRERESDLRALKKAFDMWAGYEKAIEEGKTPVDKYGSEIKHSIESIKKQVEWYEERIAAKLDELGFYQDCMEKAGGVNFTVKDIKPGYIVEMIGHGQVEILSAGPKNFWYKGKRWSGHGVYAEISAIISTEERKTEPHPFHVGDTFKGRDYVNGKRVDVTYTIIKSTAKTVTLQAGENKPFVRKPSKSLYNGDWTVSIDEYQLWTKKPEEPAASAEEPEEIETLTPDEFETRFGM